MLPTFDSGEDATWRCDPHEGFGIGVGLCDEAVNGDLKFGDRSKHATPLDPNSATISANFAAAMQPSGSISIVSNVPIWRVPVTQPTAAVALFTTDGTKRVALGDSPWTDQLISQFSAVPIPDGFAPAAGSDAEAVIYQPDTHQLWEGWLWSTTGLKVANSAGVSVDEWSIRWGGYEADLRTSDGTWAPQSPSGVKGGMAAAGIHWLSFDNTLGDLYQQAINHPVGVVCPVGAIRSDVWNCPPAWRTDGYPFFPDPNYPAEGCVFRFPANIDFNSFPGYEWDGVSVKTMRRLFAEAVRDYGMVVMDQGGGIVSNMQPDSDYPGNPTINDPILSQVLGVWQPWGYDNQYCPLNIMGQLQLLQTNLVSG